MIQRQHYQNKTTSSF